MEIEYERELEALRHKHERERDEALGQHSWKGLGLVLNAMRSVLATEQAEEKATLRERRRKAREGHRRRYPSWPSFEQWLMEQHAPELAHRWRHRDRPVPSLQGKGESRAVVRDIEGYESQVDGGRVLYRRSGAPRSRIAFTDVGRRVDIHDWRSEQSTLAALRLSAQKWERFVVNRQRRIQGDVRAPGGSPRIPDHQSRASGEDRQGACASAGCAGGRRASAGGAADRPARGTGDSRHCAGK